MDVICERCQAEYELDDALVGPRGSAVRCTACGATFRVAATGRGSERFRVVAPGGAVAEFASLRALRDALVSGAVDADAVLLDGRGGGRPLAAVDELRALDRVEADRPISLKPPPVAERDSAWEIVSTREVALIPAHAQPGQLAQALHEEAARRSSLPPSPFAMSPQPPKVRSASQSMAEIAQVAVASLPPPSAEPATVPDPPLPSGIVGAPLRPRRSEAPPPVAPRAIPATPAGIAPPAAPPQGPSPGPALLEVAGPPRKGGYGVALGAALLVGALVGGRVVLRGAPPAAPSASARVVPSAPPAAATPSPFATALDEGRLADAERALADAPPSRERDIGDLRLAVLRADLATWRTLLEKGAQKEAAERDRQGLVREAARKSDAIAAAPGGDEDVLRLARVDVMRLGGNVGRGEALLTAPLRDAPAASYTASALRFAAGGTVAWKSLLAPLRIAADRERHAGRARVALAYALAQTGDAAGALVEASRVRGSMEDRALVAALDGYLGVPAEATSAPPVTAPPPPVAAANPNGLDAAALTQKGDAARAAGRRQDARALYRRALAASPGYLPALTALGELEAESKTVDPRPRDAYPPPAAPPIPTFEPPAP